MLSPLNIVIIDATCCCGVYVLRLSSIFRGLLNIDLLYDFHCDNASCVFVKSVTLWSLRNILLFTRQGYQQFKLDKEKQLRY